MSRGSVVALLSAVMLTATIASAQTARSTLSGTVMDSSEAALPGVTVTVTQDATKITQTTFTNERGIFSVPGLDPGTYTVTATLQGFKTTIVDSIAVNAAQPTDVDVKMEIGALEESLIVTASSGLVQTQSTTITTNLNIEQLKSLPFATRNLMDSMVTLPGIDAAGINRSARINGLPQDSVVLTIDGIDARPSGGNGTQTAFYAYVFPQNDSIEQATATTAIQSAEDSGGGSAAVRFVTRAGTNNWRGSFFEYMRHPSLNSNYYFNKLSGLPKNDVKVNQMGGTIGGPIVQNRAFFFFHFERLNQPISRTDTRTTLNPFAQRGVFRYGNAASPSSVDLLALARANGHLATINPTIAGLIKQIDDSTRLGIGQLQTTANPNTDRFVFQNDGDNHNNLPTFRLDLVAGPHKVTSVFRMTELDRFLGSGASPPIFPEHPVQSRYNSKRFLGSEALRSNLGPTVVNELLGGWQTSPTKFGIALTPEKFASQGGFAVNMPLGASNPTATNAVNNRTGSLWQISDTLTMQRGAHGISLGGSFNQYKANATVTPVVPSISFGVETGFDPADAMFTAANFPGAASSDLTNARALYGFLTGRVTGITADAGLDADGNYQYLGAALDRFHVSDWAVFAQDRWHVNPQLTLNAGLRYRVQLGIAPGARNFSKATFADLCGLSGTGTGTLGRGCNLFMPGTLTGTTPVYTEFEKGDSVFKSDRNNWAPNLGMAWQPRVESGFLRTLLGNPDDATIRASFGMNFNHQGLDPLQAVFDTNPGRTVAANRNNTLGNLAAGGSPVLFTETNRLGPPATCTGARTPACMPASAVYPNLATIANSIAVFDPNLQESYSRQYSIGFARSLNANTALEVRWVGTRTFKEITSENWNEVTVVENGFLDDFKRAQANLAANVAAGRGQSFAYFGPGSGTQPLPIFLAHFNGVSAAQAGDASRYTGANWTNTTFTGLLSPFNPQPRAFASNNSTTGLYGNSTFRANGRAAGLPLNYWVLNPSVAQANYITGNLDSTYDGLQIELRRLMSKGLMLSSSYTRSTGKRSAFTSIHQETTMARDLSNVPHSAKLSAAWEIPVGRDRAFGSGMSGLMNGVIGGWGASVSARAQSGQILRLSNIKLVGMDQKELQKAFKVRIDEAAKIVYMFPQDIIDNTIKAFSTNATGYTLGAPTGRFMAPAGGPGCVGVYPGDCGEAMFTDLIGPIRTRVDASFRKQIPLGGNRGLEIQVDVLNVFDAINFLPVFQAFATQSGATGNAACSAATSTCGVYAPSQTINQVTSAFSDVDQTFDPGGRVSQLVFRFSW